MQPTFHRNRKTLMYSQEHTAKLIALASIIAKHSSIVQDDTTRKWLLVIPVQSQGRGNAMLMELNSLVTELRYKAMSADEDLDDQIRKSAAGTLENGA